MRFVPGSFAFVSVSVAKHECLEALLVAFEIAGGVTAKAAEVANGLIGFMRNVNGSEFSGTMESSEFCLPQQVAADTCYAFGIAFVRFNLIAGLLRDERWGDDFTIVS